MNGPPLNPSIWVLIAQLGFPIVVATLLLCMLTGLIPSPMVINQEVLRNHIVILSEHVAFDKENIRILRQVCRNVAKSETLKVECDR